MRVKKDSADITTYFKLKHPTTGVPVTGLTITDLDMVYTRNRAIAVKADATALGAVDAAHTDNKMIQVHSTNAPGLYRADWPDTCFATGVDKVILSITGAAINPADLQVDLIDGEAIDGWSYIIENSKSVAYYFRCIIAALYGKSDGGGTPTVEFNSADGVKPRVTATIEELTNNRTAVVLDGDL